MTEEESKLCAMAEAILFASGEPVESSRFSQALGVSEQEVSELMQKLIQRYAESESALQILHLEHAYQLAVRQEFAPVIRTAMESRRMQPLSNAAMETLTIIAYNQPVSKGFVERVRGIDSSSVVNSLADKGLVEEAGRIDVPGHPIGYRTTDLFLRVFGLHSLAELPDPHPADSGEKFTGELTEQDVSS
ncbi:MAG: SMC-Scp complex subunit ScpB [Oscillospiraceae bacterium]|nr:SMC-Scp complex subunit ScpB [Oscillospiraceae bacterium]